MGQQLGDGQGGLGIVVKGAAHMTARAPPLPGLNPLRQQVLGHGPAGPLGQRHDTDTRDPVQTPALLKLHAGQSRQRRPIEPRPRHPLAAIRRPAIQCRHPHRAGKLTQLGIGRDHLGLAVAQKAKAGHLPHPRHQGLVMMGQIAALPNAQRLGRMQADHRRQGTAIDRIKRRRRIDNHLNPGLLAKPAPALERRHMTMRRHDNQGTDRPRRLGQRRQHRLRIERAGRRIHIHEPRHQPRLDHRMGRRDKGPGRHDTQAPCRQPHRLQRQGDQLSRIGPRRHMRPRPQPLRQPLFKAADHRSEIGIPARSVNRLQIGRQGLRRRQHRTRDRQGR